MTPRQPCLCRQAGAPGKAISPGWTEANARGQAGLQALVGGRLNRLGLFFTIYVNLIYDNHKLSYQANRYNVRKGYFFE